MPYLVVSSFAMSKLRKAASAAGQTVDEFASSILGIQVRIYECPPPEYRTR